MLGGEGSLEECLNRRAARSLGLYCWARRRLFLAFGKRVRTVGTRPRLSAGGRSGEGGDVSGPTGSRLLDGLYLACIFPPRLFRGKETDRTLSGGDRDCPRRQIPGCRVRKEIERTSAVPLPVFSRSLEASSTFLLWPPAPHHASHVAKSSRTPQFFFSFFQKAHPDTFKQVQSKERREKKTLLKSQKDKNDFKNNNKCFGRP